MYSSAKFVVVFRTANDAFFPTPYAEISRILREIADNIDQSEILSGNIRDLNGNKIGTYSVKRETGA